MGPVGNTLEINASSSSSYRSAENETDHRDDESNNAKMDIESLLFCMFFFQSDHMYICVLIHNTQNNKVAPMCSNKVFHIIVQCKLRIRAMMFLNDMLKNRCSSHLMQNMVTGKNLLWI